MTRWRARCEKTDLTLPQQTEQLSASDKVHDHVEVLRVLERAPQVDEERVAHALEHLALRVGVLHLLHLDNPLLRKDLDRV